MKNLIIKIILIIIITIFIVCGIIYLVKKQNPQAELEENYNKFKQESPMYDEDADIEDLKEEYNIEGNSELYEIQTEYDGRKVLAIKASENYKVAFAGLIKKSKPTFEETTKIFEEQYPKQAGIWIEPESRQIILNYLNNNLNSSYEIEENGFIKILEYIESENDKILNQIINGEKQYILGISGITYNIDTLTGEIIDNPYEEFDSSQTYSYFQDENKMIIYIPENKDNHINENEIFNSILKLVQI